MVSNAMKKELHKLRIEHNNMGLMLGELDNAVQVHSGEDLVNAINDIGNRYGYVLS